MRISEIRRYPVKSMLGERVPASSVGFAGLAFDRGLALIDVESGLVATAKHPRLWRGLLKYRADVHHDGVRIVSPDGRVRWASDGDVDAALSDELGRPVRLVSERPERATVERSDPEEVIRHGVAARLPTPTLQIGQGTPGANFVDYAPVHVITTATLDAIGADRVRYRPNLVIDTPPGTKAFVENDWVGRALEVVSRPGPGSEAGVVALRISIPTPRCAVPTLEHGDLPPSVDAVRALMAANRVEVPGFGVLPCAGGYAEVLRAGTVHLGDQVEVR